MLRGNGGQPIFFSDEDRNRFCLLLQEGTQRFNYRIHAYCLMENHLHLVIQVADVPLSRAMQNLSFRHTRWVNAREDRAGHLFQGRYKAILVDAESYLNELVRYVHLNPVRAGIVDEPSDYAWSGHQTYLGLADVPWLTTDWLLSQFAKTRKAARRRYERFVAMGMAEGYRPEFHTGGNDTRVLADDDFVERVLGSGPDVYETPSLDKIVRTVCAHTGATEQELSDPSRMRRFSRARALIGWLAFESGAATLTAVAARFNRDVATLSRQVAHIDQERRDSDELDEQLHVLDNAITQA
jgi:REP element-mobilizing transposase RayT